MADRAPAKRKRAARREQAADVVESGVRAGARGRVDATVAPEDLLDANPEAVLGVDSSGTIQIANQAAAKLFGYPVDQLVGGSVERLLPESARARHAPMMDAFFTQPGSRNMGSGLPLTARRRNGDVFFADISLAAVESPSHGAMTVLTARDVSEHRRERLLAAQYLVTRALAESVTLEGAASAVLAATGPASGADVAALWVVDGFGAVRFVDSWCASARVRTFHEESVGHVFEPGSGLLGGVVVDPHVKWTTDVLSDPRFHRPELAGRLGLHAGVWVPFADEQERVLGVLELLFGVVREPDPAMLQVLEGFATQLSQYPALRQSEAGRQRVLGQIVKSVEDERRRIASELHDDTVQVLVASLLSIDRLDRAIDPANTRGHELAAIVRQTLEAATDRTRHLIFDLRPQLLEAEGVMAAIAAVAAVAGRDGGFDVDVEQSAVRFDPAVEALLHRVMQEAIANARMHARPTIVRCSLRTLGGGVIAEVADDGIGFHVDDATDRARRRMSFGLSTIIELVRLAGGQVTVTSAPGEGTLVSIWLPLHLTPSGARSRA